MSEIKLMQVAHAKKSNFGFPRPVYPADFEVVALVEVPDGTVPNPDQAYQLTNHIDKPWWENAAVTLVGAANHRSTSVGDLVVMPDGKILRCENLGWAELQGVK